MQVLSPSQALSVPADHSLHKYKS